MGPDLDLVQGAVVLFLRVICAVTDCTGNAFIFVCHHDNFLLFCGLRRQTMRYRFSMSWIDFFISGKYLSGKIFEHESIRVRSKRAATL